MTIAQAKQIREWRNFNSFRSIASMCYQDFPELVREFIRNDIPIEKADGNQLVGQDLCEKAAQLLGMSEDEFEADAIWNQRLA